MARPAPGDSSQPAEAVDAATEQQRAAEASQPAVEDEIQVVQGGRQGPERAAGRQQGGRAAEPSKPASPAVDEEIAGKRFPLSELEHATWLQQQQAQRPELIAGPH